MQRLQAFLNRVRAAGFLLKAKTCAFFQESVTFLSHILSKAGIKTQDSNIQKILHWPRPTSVKEFKSWHGFSNYYASLFTNMAAVAQPLDNFCRKNKNFKWSNECENAFLHL